MISAPFVVLSPNFEHNYTVALIQSSIAKIIHCPSGNVVHEVDLKKYLTPKTTSQKQKKKSKDEDEEANPDNPEHETLFDIAAAAFYCSSKDEKYDYFAVVGDTKQVILSIFDKESVKWTTVAKTEQHKKKLSCLLFATQPETQQLELFFGDKFGEVYSFSITDCVKQFTSNVDQTANTLVNITPTLRLGHVSLLTDMVLSKNQKYLITSDRDERIRISEYPIVYEIFNFCLDHESVVTCLAALEANQKQILISGSVDQTLRVWDIENTEKPLLLTLPVGDLIPQRIDTLKYLNETYLVVTFEKSNQFAVCHFNAQNLTLELLHLQVFEQSLCVFDVKFCQFGANVPLLWILHQSQHGTKLEVKQVHLSPKEFSVVEYSKGFLPVDLLQKQVTSFESFALDELKNYAVFKKNERFAGNKKRKAEEGEETGDSSTNETEAKRKK